MVQSIGKLDILVNNAGIMNDAEWETQVDVNYVRVEYYFELNLMQPAEIDWEKFVIGLSIFLLLFRKEW